MAFSLATLRSLMFSLASCAIACGGGAVSGADVDAGLDAPSTADAPSADAPPTADASPNDATPEASSFACGNAICDPSQICLYPAYGCAALAPADAGVCPAGTTYLDASGNCLPPTPTPSCVSPLSVSYSIDCSEGATVPNCDLVNPPIPSGCSRVCRAICA
jgi:hypothetical protein